MPRLDPPLRLVISTQAVPGLLTDWTVARAGLVRHMAEGRVHVEGPAGHPLDIATVAACELDDLEGSLLIVHEASLLPVLARIMRPHRP